MFGGLIAALLCYWFYQTAIRVKLNPLQWVIGALVIFYAVRFAWTFAVLKPLMGAAFKAHGMVSGVMIELSGAVIAAAVVALFHKKVMLKQAR
ncbi:hypothetical protein ACW73L_08390 [Methylolobus aquaticus]